MFRGDVLFPNILEFQLWCLCFLTKTTGNPQKTIHPNYDTNVNIKPQTFLVSSLLWPLKRFFSFQHPNDQNMVFRTKRLNVQRLKTRLNWTTNPLQHPPKHNGKHNPQNQFPANNFLMSKFQNNCWHMNVVEISVVVSKQNSNVTRTPDVERAPTFDQYPTPMTLLNVRAKTWLSYCFWRKSHGI